MYSNPCTSLDGLLGLREVQAPRISRQSEHEDGRVVNPSHRPPLPPRMYSFLLEAESTRSALMRPECISQRKIRVTPLGSNRGPSGL
jgi:hypothetical protein